MSHFVGVGIFRIDLSRTDLGCCRLTLRCTCMKLGPCYEEHVDKSILEEEAIEQVIIGISPAILIDHYKPKILSSPSVRRFRAL